MTEFIACYALSTWFLDAFDVVGFLWPSGGYGTGKTKLGLLVCEVAYLGEALLSGSTYACLRDLADLGATLLFDDAENLADPKHKDPDKRNLLLAGNRKGTVVAVKEADGKGIWRTRYVNAYCPRLFTATKLPDAILASRTIVIPLVRTADPKKANADVLDFRLWPHDRRKLLDDLWAVALGNLAQMPAHLAAVNEDAPLLGRNLEPWKATLAVAHWLDHRGEGGLYERMRSLAQSYQTDQIQLAVPDLTTIIARAIIQKVCHECHYSISAINSETYSDFTTEDISEEVKRLIKGEDIDLDLDYITSRRVGRALGKLRLTQLPRAGGKGSRKWRISASQLEQLSRSYAVPTPTQLNGTNGIMALMAQVEPTPVGEVLQ
ncbi:MAG: hypothetical protein FJY85_10730 [Deltaproteobacteria bacterium]|nr:hypothetical protein [Deltaproteobacteria bacterium]